MECTVRPLVGAGGRSCSKYLATVERIWRVRVGRLERKSGLLTGDLRQWRDEVEAAVWDAGACAMLAAMNPRNDAVAAAGDISISLCGVDDRFCVFFFFLQRLMEAKRRRKGTSLNGVWALRLFFGSNGLLFNTIGDFDWLGLSYFTRKFNLPVWPVGPVLLPSESRASMGKQNKTTSDLCIKWLDSKPSKSVLYVSFGSMNTISSSQMVQLATALEKSDRRFVWVVRPPIGSDINSEFKTEEWLPKRFLERVSERGLVVHNWAPQVEILSHRAERGMV